MGRVGEDYGIELAQTPRKFHTEKKEKINPGFYKLIYNSIFHFVFSFFLHYSSLPYFHIELCYSTQRKNSVENVYKFVIYTLYCEIVA